MHIEDGVHSSVRFTNYLQPSDKLAHRHRQTRSVIEARWGNVDLPRTPADCSHFSRIPCFGTGVRPDLHT